MFVILFYKDRNSTTVLKITTRNFNKCFKVAAPQIMAHNIQPQNKKIVFNLLKIKTDLITFFQIE